MQNHSQIYEEKNLLFGFLAQNVEFYFFIIFFALNENQSDWIKIWEKEIKYFVWFNIAKKSLSATQWDVAYNLVDKLILMFLERSFLHPTAKAYRKLIARHSAQSVS